MAGNSLSRPEQILQESRLDPNIGLDHAVPSQFSHAWDDQGENVKLQIAAKLPSHRNNPLSFAHTVQFLLFLFVKAFASCPQTTIPPHVLWQDLVWMRHSSGMVLIESSAVLPSLTWPNYISEVNYISELEVMLPHCGVWGCPIHEPWVSSTLLVVSVLVMEGSCFLLCSSIALVDF